MNTKQEKEIINHADFLYSIGEYDTPRDAVEEALFENGVEMSSDEIDYLVCKIDSGFENTGDLYAV